MIHINFSFSPGSCGDFFVKSLHLMDNVALELSTVNNNSAIKKLKAHSYTNVSNYNNYHAFETANVYTGTSWNHLATTCDILIWHRNNHRFYNLSDSNIVGDSDTEIRIIMDMSNMEKFVFCNGFIKDSVPRANYKIAHATDLMDSTAVHISLENIVCNREGFLAEYYKVAKLLNNEEFVNEEYAVMLYNEWKKTLPQGYENVPLEKWLLDNVG